MGRCESTGPLRFPPAEERHLQGESPHQSQHVVMPAHQVSSYAPFMEATDHASYEIRVKGHLDARWSAWFDGLSLSHESDGTTLMRGPVVDQAALHGVLQKLRDVGMPLVSVTQVPDPLITAGATTENIERTGPESP